MTMTANSLTAISGRVSISPRTLALVICGHVISIIGGLTILRVSLLISIGLLMLGGFLVWLPKPRIATSKLSWREHLAYISVCIGVLFSVWFLGEEASRQWPISPFGFILSWSALFHGYRDIRNRRNA